MSGPSSVQADSLTKTPWPKSANTNNDLSLLDHCIPLSQPYYEEFELDEGELPCRHTNSLRYSHPERHISLERKPMLAQYITATILAKSFPFFVRRKANLSQEQLDQHFCRIMERAQATASKGFVIGTGIATDASYWTTSLTEPAIYYGVFTTEEEQNAMDSDPAVNVHCATGKQEEEDQLLPQAGHAAVGSVHRRKRKHWKGEREGI